METSGSVKACNGIAVTFTFFSRYCSFNTTQKQANQTAVTSKRLDLPRSFNCNREDKKCRYSANCVRPLCLCVFRKKRHIALCTTFLFLSLSVIQELCHPCCVCVKLGKWLVLKNNCVKWGVFNDYTMKNYMFRLVLAIFNTTERYVIYREFSLNNHLNDETKKAPPTKFRCVAENSITTK